MAGLFVYTSSKLELLAGEFARMLRDNPPQGALEPELVVVQTKGMERWIALELASRNSICCNFRFLSPEELVKDVVKRVTGEEVGESPLDGHNMVWGVMRLLKDEMMEKGTEMERIRRYVAGDDFRLYQLARRIADLFDQYMVYRPDFLEAWEEGKVCLPGNEDEKWQQLLWKRMAEEYGARERGRHRVRRRLIETLEKASFGSFPSLPQRMSVFGVSLLPPCYLQLLRAVSLHSDVHVFALAPAPLDRWVGRRGAAGQPLVHQLLSSMGGPGREFFSELLIGGNVHLAEFFEDPLSCRESSLARLQAAIMGESDKGSTGPVGKVAAGDGSLDNSIIVVSCHGPMREVEVLYDHILDVLAKNEAISPKDILVMAPDIEAYAPLVDAVFGTAEREIEIPYSIADRPPRGVSRMAETFLEILALPTSRLELYKVLAIARAAPVMARYGLTEKDIEDLGAQLADCGVRWGIDERHREAEGLPARPEHTWRAGMRRLLLGFAMSPEWAEAVEEAVRGEESVERNRLREMTAEEAVGPIFGGILPFEGSWGKEGAVAGRFMAFCEELFAFVETVQERRTVPLWGVFLRRLLDLFFARTEETEPERRRIEQVIDRFVSGAELAGMTNDIPFAVVRSFIEESLGRRGSERGFIRSGVTFSSMMPMRSIPFRVVCLLGMNYDSFPRKPVRPAFDLMGVRPRPGDRNPRESDRYLFLETILSARDLLYISYSGRDAHDNSQRLPSVVVHEMIEALSGLGGGGSDESGRLLAIEQRLQAFSPAYFNGSAARLFSYSKENYEAACCLASALPSGGITVARRLLERIAVSDRDEKVFDLSAADLALFFRNPARYFLTRRIKMRLSLPEKEQQETEPFLPDSLENFIVRQSLVEGILDGRPERCGRMVLDARGLLPHGTAGWVVFRKNLEEAASFTSRVAKEIGTARRRDVKVACTIGRFRLSASLSCISPSCSVSRHIMFRPSKLKARDRLTLWIHHLLGCMEEPMESLFVGSDATIVYEPLEVCEAREKMGGLLEVYREGMERVIPFFPATSYEYALAVMEGKDPESAAKRAARVWWRFDPKRRCDVGELVEDPYWSLCFGAIGDAFFNKGDDLFQPDLFEDFIRLARLVFGPLIEARQRQIGNEEKEASDA